MMLYWEKKQIVWNHGYLHKRNNNDFFYARFTNFLDGCSQVQITCCIVLKATEFNR